VKCFITQSSLKATEERRGVKRFSIGPILRSDTDFWEANLRLGETLKIQLWNKYKLQKTNKDYVGEILDIRRSVINPQELSYFYFTDPKFINVVKKAKLPKNHPYLSFPGLVLYDNHLSEQFKKITYLYAIGQKNTQQQQLKLETDSRAVLHFDVVTLYPHHSMNLVLIIRFFEKLRVQFNKEIQRSTMEKLLNYLNCPYEHTLKRDLDDFFKNEIPNSTLSILPESHYLQILFAVLKLDRRTDDEEYINKRLPYTFRIAEKMSLNRWAKFLKRVQKERITPEKIFSLFQKYPNPLLRRPEEELDPPLNVEHGYFSKLSRWYVGNPHLQVITENYPHLQTSTIYWGMDKRRERMCTSRMFYEYLFDPVENSIMDKDKANLHLNLDYMDESMHKYWIDSSHNTYLLGDQLKSKSSIEQYRRALLRGCRCLELDIWPAPDGTPIVYHGYTLTSKIPFADCIEAICQSAFITSKYPVILSLEVNCNQKVRMKMAYIIQSLLNHPTYRDYFGDALGYHRKEFTKDFKPCELTHKILIKAHWKEWNDDPEPIFSDSQSDEEIELPIEKPKIGKRSFLKDRTMELEDTKSMKSHTESLEMEKKKRESYKMSLKVVGLKVGFN
jgi:hypothetical protein